ncbi:MAG TPA: OB-fold domain-containing protein [Candidatus Binatia bacterium]|jgi:hypothetical protein
MAEKSLPKINQIDRPFWQAAADGKFMLQHCRACGKLQFFPRAVCTGCFSLELDWQAARGEGEIHSFTWVFVPRNPAFKDEVPICYANVVLDEGVILESRIVGKGVEEIKLGDRVRVIFQATSDPAIKLPVFELADRS